MQTEEQNKLHTEQPENEAGQSLSGDDDASENEEIQGSSVATEEAPETSPEASDDDENGDFDEGQPVALADILADEDEEEETEVADSDASDDGPTTTVTIESSLNKGLGEAPKEVRKSTEAAAADIGGDATKPGKPAQKRKRWYIVHTYSGHENKVKVNLERRIESMSMADKIFRVEVPQKTITKVKDGKRMEKDERIFPGYVLVEMIMDDDSWYVVRHTPGVTKFVGSERKPIPAKDSEIKRILFRAEPVKAKAEIDLKTGETVKIISGPFADFEGTVTEVHPDKERLKATVSIFGRETPVELVFSQVQKIS